MVRRDARSLGNDAEQLAFRFLCNEGLRPVTRNYRCRLGEIDLVMLDDNCVVFVEVRFRSPNRFSRAALTVDRVKQYKLARAADMFLSGRPAFAGRSARFDVVGVDRTTDGKLSIEWLRDAFCL